jgi:hypothetical protein
MDPSPNPVDSSSSSDPGLRAHLLRQRHWQRHQEERQQQHPFPPPPPPVAAPYASAGGGGHRPLLLRLLDGQGHGQQIPSPAALLVEDQFALSRFWSDWRAAEHRFLTKAAAAEAAAGRGGASSSSRFGALICGWLDFCVWTVRAYIYTPSIYRTHL